jgi:hypothetical protein
MLHKLWRENEGELSFFPVFNTSARDGLSADAELIWTCEAPNYFAAMTAYYEFMDWGVYISELEELYSLPYTQEDKDWG